MSIRIFSKFNLRRLGRTLGARLCVNLMNSKTEDLGFCTHAYTKPIGGKICTIFEQAKQDSTVATIVLRGSTNNVMSDMERAISDGVNVIRSMTKNSKFVAGA